MRIASGLAHPQVSVGVIDSGPSHPIRPAGSGISNNPTCCRQCRRWERRDIGRSCGTCSAVVKYGWKNVFFSELNYVCNDVAEVVLFREVDASTARKVQVRGVCRQILHRFLHHVMNVGVVIIFISQSTAEQLSGIQHVLEAQICQGSSTDPGVPGVAVAVAI